VADAAPNAAATVAMPDIDRQTTEPALSAEIAGSAANLPAPVPFAAPQRGLLARFLDLFRGKPSDIREELTGALSLEQGPPQPGGLSANERAMLNNILRLNEVRVSDVMVSRGEIESMELSTTLAEALEAFERSGHSRMPVYHETMDDPRGMIHIKDLVAHITKAARKKTRGRKPAGDKTPLADLKLVDLSQTLAQTKLWRPVLFVPASMPAAELMTQMQAKRIQMALVIDEYGGTDGLLSLEDIVEMIVGDIEDEHDEDEPLIERRPDGTFIVDARAEIDDVAQVVGGSFTVGEHAEDVDTIGGVAVSALGRLPLKGEIIHVVDGFEIEVIDADVRRVKRLRIRPTRAAEPRKRGKTGAPETGRQGSAEVETEADAEAAGGQAKARMPAARTPVSKGGSAKPAPRKKTSAKGGPAEEAVSKAR
jgi:CBS domain containing-hemolysin-like protein